jgi:hypothetical protein
MPKSWKAILEQHFKAQGMDLSNGIRQVLAGCMKSEGPR